MKWKKNGLEKFEDIKSLNSKNRQLNGQKKKDQKNQTLFDIILHRKLKIEKDKTGIFNLAF
jgi:ribosome-binding protein aMBF1 (putative translation factor)